MINRSIYLLACLLVFPTCSGAQEKTKESKIKVSSSSRSNRRVLSRDTEAEFRSDDGMFTLKGYPIWSHGGVYVIKRSSDGKIVAMNHTVFLKRDSFWLTNANGVRNPSLEVYESQLKADLDKAVILALKKKCENMEKRIKELEQVVESHRVSDGESTTRN